jgi:hypothetical protein
MIRRLLLLGVSGGALVTASFDNASAGALPLRYAIAEPPVRSDRDGSARCVPPFAQGERVASNLSVVRLGDSLIAVQVLVAPAGGGALSLRVSSGSSVQTHVLDLIRCIGFNAVEVHEGLFRASPDQLLLAISGPSVPRGAVRALSIFNASAVSAPPSAIDMWGDRAMMGRDFGSLLFEVERIRQYQIGGGTAVRWSRSRRERGSGGLECISELAVGGLVRASTSARTLEFVVPPGVSRCQ